MCTVDNHLVTTDTFDRDKISKKYTLWSAKGPTYVNIFINSLTFLDWHKIYG